MKITFLLSFFSIEEKHYENNFNLRVNNTINQIKSAVSFNNNFFICFKISNIPSCYINDNLTNSFDEIKCKYTTYFDSRYKVLYFNETDEFLFVSRYDLTTTIVNNSDFSQQQCSKRGIFDRQNGNNFEMFYDEGYKVLNYTNFTNYNKCYNISILEEEEILNFSIQIEKTYVAEMIYSTNMPTTNIPTTNIIVPTTNIIAPTTNSIVPTTNLIVPFINNTSDYYIYENYTYGIIPIQNISSIPLTDAFSGTIFSTTLDDTIIEKGINPLTTQLLEESKISTIIQENNTMTTLEIIETDINTTSLITSITQPNSQTDYSNKDKTYYQSQSYNKISEYISHIESNFITNLIITGNNEEVYQEVINNVIQNYDISKGEEMIFKGEDN